MFKIGKKTKETIGLDIGNFAIKVTALMPRSDKPLLTAYNVKNIPLYDSKPAKVGKLIKEALDEIDLSPNEVNLSISGSNVIVRFIDLPKMSKEQLENAMIFEAERYIPFSVNEVILDFLILDAPESGQMNVLLAAAKRDFVQSRIELLQKLGININILDISAFAGFNAFRSCNSLVEETGTAFLDLGHSQTNLLVTGGDIPRFMRVIQIGGKDITTALSEDLGVTLQEAEELKMGGARQDDEKVQQSTYAVLDELIKEIKLSFGYFENKYNGSIGNVYCSGGMIYQHGILEYLKQKMGTEFRTWNPIGGVEISDSLSREAIEPVSGQLAVSIGLGLRR